jgi:hypothetical protein
VFNLKNSSTILLPAWYKTLSAHGLPPRMMPRDVPTRWNSTFDMLDFAIWYCVAINVMTAVRELDLRKYELGAGEWQTANELREVLDMSISLFCFFRSFAQFCVGFQTSDSVLFTPPLTWQLLFWLWISSTMFFLYHLIHLIDSALRFMPLLPSEKKL